MQDPSKKRRQQILLVGGIVLATVIITVLVLLLGTNKKSGTNTEQYDPNSGETYSTITGKSPETYGQDTQQPTYLGIDKLVDRGLSLGQIKSLQSGYTEFINQNKIKVSIVSVKIATITKNPHSPTDPALAVITYETVFDNKTTYKTQVEYKGLSYIKLSLSDTSGKQLFQKAYDPEAPDTTYDKVDE